MNSGFDDRNIIPLYLEIAPSAYESSTAAMLGMDAGSNRASEDYGFLGGNPALREWIGKRQIKTLPVKQYKLTNRHFEATLEIGADEMRRDQTSLLKARMATFAGDVVGGHWIDLAAELINANGLCYDGQNFFDTDHLLGDSGTQLNELAAAQCPSLNVGTATAPTAAEFATALLEVVGYMMTIKNSAGRYVNTDAKKFHIQCSTVQIWAAAQAAVSGNYLQATVDNPLKSINATFTVGMDPRITGSTARFNVFRTDAPLKPFIWQTEQDPEYLVLGPGSDHYFQTKKYLLGVDTWRAAGYGLWEYAARATLS
jgi:phage major head subunit gpT-like protein